MKKKIPSKIKIDNNLEIIFFGNLSRTFLASLIIMSFFFISPMFVEFAKNASFTSMDFENNSKNSLKNLLEKKK